MLIAAVLAVPVAHAADATIDFEQPAAGTTITNQYADAGVPGQGVVFGPLPGAAGDGNRPKLLIPGGGQAFSGTQVADLSVFAGPCEFCTASTTGTFASPRTRVAVHVGYLGPAAPACKPFNEARNECARVTLLGYDADGVQVATSGSTLVTSGAGLGTVLTIQTATAQIVGFRVTARQSGGGGEADGGKQIAIDDLSFDIPSTPAPPDFSLTPDAVNPVIRQGQTITDPITIGRLSGSSGNIALALGGTLPAGIHASVAPNPVSGTSSVLTLTADPGAAPTGPDPIAITLTGTPGSAGAGSAPRTVTISLQVRQAFDVRASGPASVDLAPCVVRIPFLVTRDFSLAGPVDLSVTGLANGLTARFDPPSATFPNGAAGETVQLIVTAPATGLPLPATTLTVHAFAPPLAERTATTSVGGTCPAQYDGQVTSLQITQGTQSRYLPARDGVHQSITSYAEIAGAARLRRDGPTVVRAYADNNFGPTEGVGNVPMVLAGWYHDRNGTSHPLPGSPLLANSGTRRLFNGAIDPTIPEMESDTRAYTFTLPPEWTHYEIGVSAQLQPALPAVAPARAVAACTTPACQVNDQMAISRIPFYGAPNLTITPLEMRVGSTPLPSAEDVFKWVRLTTPLQIYLKPYQGTIDITDISNGSGNGDARNSAVEDRVDDWTCDHGITAIGVNTGVARGLTRTGSWCWSGLTTYDSATVEYRRPLTSVGHEWYHLLGRKHASAGCGGGANGQRAEAWPPDEMGFLQSVGLDTQLGSGRGGAPYAVIPGSPGLWFDLMSYCANSGSLTDPLNDALTLNAWISVHNWTAVMNDRAYLRATPVSARARAAVPRRPALHVAATVPPDGDAAILSVTPLRAPAQQSSASSYHLVALDTAGSTLTDVALLETSDHVDGQPAPVALNGVVPAAGVASVAVVRDGVTLATRTRSATAPAITAVTVHTGRRNATVRWRSSDGDRDRLLVTVDYSSHGGRRFHRIYTGPDRGRARVPARYLSRAARARVRVTVNDGFRAATALSRVFRAPGAAPTVTIVSPATGLRQPNDATLALSGAAFDDRGTPLTGGRLKWRLGRRLLGTGQQIAVAALPAGRRVITLTARDRAGRTARARLAVALSAARPLFLKLSAPKVVKRTARSLRLRVSASLPARLVVAGRHVRTHRAAVGRSVRRLRVAIRPGRRALKLTLRLHAGGRTTPRTLSVRRR